MPDRMPNRMPEDMPEDMPDRMSEDLPVTKRINDMVGITRSKVIYINCTVILIDIFTRIFMKSSCSREQDYIDSAKFIMTYEALA
jgi:hypothetical protein